MKKRNGFTLVELLAVIVILAVILIIAVPTISTVINDAKESSFKSSAKMLLSSAEKDYMSKTALGTAVSDITSLEGCKKIAKLSSNDYESCKIKYDETGNATVYLGGAGQFDGKYVCGYTSSDGDVSIVDTCTELTDAGA